MRHYTTNVVVPGDGEHVGLGAGALAVAAHDDVGRVVAHEEPEALDALAEAAHALAALVDAHQAAEVEAAVVGEEARELLPAAEVERVAVGREELVDGEAVVGRELAHGNPPARDAGSTARASYP